MEIDIKEVKVKKRIRQDVGDLETLTKSIEERGLLQPIVIDADKQLIAGFRRLQVFKRLKRSKIKAVIVKTVSEALEKLAAERDENVCRKDFNPSEIAACAEAMRKLIKPRVAPVGRPRKLKPGESLPDEKITESFRNKKPRGDTEREQVGEAFGVSGRTLAKIQAVTKSGDKEAIAEMDRTGKVDKAYRKVTAGARVDKIKQKTAELPKGEFQVILADPPWRYEHSKTDSRKIENQYPTLELDAIKSLKVPAAEDCVLFLWATSPKLDEALEVLKAWGFLYRTCMVWHKPQIGMGYYVRSQHELLLIGTRGKPGVPEEGDRPSSMVEANRGKHSEKPEVFYKLIEKMYPHRKRIELFCRKQRGNWEAFGNEC